MPEKNSTRSWVTCVISSLFFSFVIFQINIFNPLNQSLIHAFNLSSAQFGNLAAGYFYGNVIFLIPAGILLDRLPTKRVLQTVTALSVVFTYLFAQAHSLWFAELMRFALGLTGAFAFISVMKLNNGWFTKPNLLQQLGSVLPWQCLEECLHKHHLNIYLA